MAPSPLRVLVAEDSETNRLVIAAMLTDLPVTLDFAADGAEAVEAAARQPYDLILMDLSMPRLDGIAAARAIHRRAACNPYTPIVALTATVTPDVERRCVAAGMSGYMPKPIARSELLDCLERWAGRLAEPAPDDLLDLEALARLRRDVGAASGRLLASFSGEARDRRDRLVAAAAAGDAAAVGHEAHALKSTSATYAARQLAAAAARIEAAAEANALSRAQPDVNRLAALVEATLAALAAQPSGGEG